MIELDVLCRPSGVGIAFEPDNPHGLAPAGRAGQRWQTSGAEIGIYESAEALRITVEAERPISRVVLRWPGRFASGTLLLGDAWERGYGDLQWRGLQPDRILPWYFAAHDPRSGLTRAAGVRVQPSALCFWMADDAGVSLWLDLRNGTMPALLNGRLLEAAMVVTVHTGRQVDPYDTIGQLCAKMSSAPRLPASPVAGNNNWYYAYGENFNADTMRRDAAFLSSLAGGHAVRPFCVIDAGWTPGGICPGGPWTGGRDDTFPDMPVLARDMKKLGVRPGIWVRPTALSFIDDPKRLRPGPNPDREKPLDLTLEENLRTIHDDIARLREWGYELIKHDYSTFDIFARWGMNMGADLSDGHWSFTDRSLTNAEIILRLYRILRDAAGDALLLGCNTIGHLGAGLFEVQRTGDDTSGRYWTRTRKLGVNTVAFRGPQHGTFFIADPDCCPYTPQTPWDKNRQFLDLVARSGQSLFISADPDTTPPDVVRVLHDAMQLALDGGEKGGARPLDWLHTTTPRRWRIGEQAVEYDWMEPLGAWPTSVI
jgi:alpha-galactosidase